MRGFRPKWYRVSPTLGNSHSSIYLGEGPLPQRILGFHGEFFSMDTTQGTTPAEPAFLQSYRMGFAVTAVEMAERIGLVTYLNTHLRWDPQQCRVSPGTRLLALMVTFLVDPRALYRIPEFYEELDCAILFGAERQADDFNDDAIGRALEKLFESQAGQIHTGLCTQAVERLGLDPTPHLHCDTTSLTLTAQYPDPGPGSQPA